MELPEEQREVCSLLAEALDDLALSQGKEELSRDPVNLILIFFRGGGAELIPQDDWETIFYQAAKELGYGDESDVVDLLIEMQDEFFTARERLQDHHQLWVHMRNWAANRI